MYIVECILIGYILIGCLISNKIMKDMKEIMENKEHKDNCKNCHHNGTCDPSEQEECKKDIDELSSAFELALMSTPTVRLYIIVILLWLPLFIFSKIK